MKVSYHQVSFDRVSYSSGGLTQQCRPHTSTVDGLPELTTLCQSVPTGSSSRSSSIDFNNIAFELLTSGAMPNSVLGDSAQWYMNGGIQLVSSGGQNDTILGLGACVVLPVDKYEVFARVEHANDFFLGAGFRYLIK